MVGRIAKWTVTLALAAAALYLVSLVYLRGHPIWALVALTVCGVSFYVFLSARGYVYRYLFPGFAGMLVFVVLPLVYTVQIGFTNYSSAHLLAFDRARQYLLEEVVRAEDGAMGFTLHPDGGAYRLVLAPPPEEGSDGAGPPRGALVSPPLGLLPTDVPGEIRALPLTESGFKPAEPLPVSEVIRNRAALSRLQIRLPDGKTLTYAGVREFAPQQKLYREAPGGALIDTRTGDRYLPNFDTGFFELAPSADKNVAGAAGGKTLQPGFRAGIGFDNYLRIAGDPEFRGPFLAIFLWTVIFAGLTVLLTLAVGCTLAVVLNWEAVRFRVVYRTLLFLPYAVPGFISILVFKGLFNAHFGEINLILKSLFSVQPQWFADPFLAKVMILLVNTWLGYPYVMVLCAGLIKTIPSDVYEASAIAGVGPLRNFFQITFPLIVKPLMPLLIASFAFNFNNFVLVSLLTDGRPDFLNTRVPAGTTDILVSYTYRIAFRDSGQNFGLAGAISTLIFVMVALLSMLNLKLTRVNQQASR